MWHVYILKCGNGSLYTGITDNLERRFKEHARGKGGHFTRSFGAEKILYSEKCPDKSSALKREARIKGWPRREKLALIANNTKRNYSKKMRRLREILRSTGGLVVAFSGGLDSAFLAAVAKQELGKRMVAVTKLTPLQSLREQKETRAVAKTLGLRHAIIRSDDLFIPQVARNDKLRCYFCKKALFGKLKKIAEHSGFKYVADGSNIDDLKDVRPGRRAIREYGILCPLIEAGLDKAAIRAISIQMGLPTAGKKSESCLATRVPFGERITRKKLKAIESMENGLHRLGFQEVRARHHGVIVRIEVGASEIGRLLLPEMRKKIIVLGKQSGFKFVSVDLEGYRRGSMNELVDSGRHD